MGSLQSIIVIQMLQTKQTNKNRIKKTAMYTNLSSNT